MMAALWPGVALSPRVVLSLHALTQTSLLLWQVWLKGWTLSAADLLSHVVAHATSHGLIGLHSLYAFLKTRGTVRQCRLGCYLRVAWAAAAAACCVIALLTTHWLFQGHEATGRSAVEGAVVESGAACDPVTACAFLGSVVLTVDALLSLSLQHTAQRTVGRTVAVAARVAFHAELLWAQYSWSPSSGQLQCEAGFSASQHAAVALLQLAWGLVAVSEAVPFGNLRASLVVGGLRDVVFHIVGFIQGTPVQVLRPSAGSDALIKTVFRSRDKGTFLEHMHAMPVWRPLISVESVSGPDWVTSRRAFVEVFAKCQISSRAEAVTKRHFELLADCWASRSAPARADVSHSVRAGADRHLSGNHARFSDNLVDERLLYRDCQGAVAVRRCIAATFHELLFCIARRASSSKSPRNAVTSDGQKNQPPPEIACADILLWAELAESFAFSLSARRPTMDKQLVRRALRRAMKLGLEVRFAGYVLQALLVSPIINLHEGLISLLPSQATANSGPAQDKKPPRVSEQTAYFALAQQPPFPIFERYCNGVQYVINNDEWKRNEPEDTEHPVSNAQAPDNFRPEQSSWAVFGSGPRQCPGRQVALTVLSAASSALLAGDRVIDPADGHNCSGRSNDGKNFGLVAQVTVIGQILSRAVRLRWQRADKRGWTDSPLPVFD